jgi:TM2 domain-containing membrane protein YozV
MEQNQNTQEQMQQQMMQMQQQMMQMQQQNNQPRKIHSRTRVNAALLAFFLGGLGAHKFYLGKPVAGLIYLVFCWTFIPGLIALAEFIYLLIQSDEEFDRQYNYA